MEMSTIREKPIARTSLTESVYESLLSAIISGTLPSGSILTTVTLSAQLGVSRTPIQEALNRLAADGLVECETGRRAKVARFNRDDVIEIYRLRQLLEGEASARAAVRIAAAETMEFRQRLVDLHSAAEGEDRDAWCAQALECDLWFHRRLAELAGSQRLASDIQRYRLLIRSFCRLVGSVDNLQQAIREHLIVVDALETNSPEAARVAMVDHIASRLDAVLDELFPAETQSKPDQ
ncbi:GntR family transcriptional regulator [Blastopirellula marina]|uniref:Transcriptional regulator, GntR family protein n=1 Tax=Blastopirellula marina DSM 3645 TaxID=314230 RepID=A3ZY53_9BACT|nr:GntR family transcriptional regulator [Blastopirellula marina]EAQ78524.1 transcriptional regulator, GntR family protein [Blastopirellula marina DSM 3645]